jgi:CheY-like chemotaxis protein
LDVIRRTGLEASELTRQLLMFAGQGGTKRTAVDVTEVIAGCVELLRPRFGSEIRVTTHFANERAPIGADRSQLQRVLINLLTNAFEAMEGRGAIDVGTRVEMLDAAALAQFHHAESAVAGEFIVLHVADTGRGIDADAVKRIFEPFFSTKFTGRGLGLATVLGIVQSHAGAIRVSSRLGHGTCFEIALPKLAQGEVPAADAQRGRTRAAQAARPKLLASGSVLLIDDDNQVRRVVEQLLIAIGLDVKAAPGGAAGLQVYDEQPGGIAVVVLDWLMPEMPGDEVLRELRRRDRTLPVILMSGYGSDRLDHDDEHVVCLQKPMTLDELEAAVRRVCAPRMLLAQA